MSDLKHILKLSGKDWLTVFEAVFYLALARILLATLPFEKIKNKMVARHKQCNPRPLEAVRVGRILRAVARRMPWNCQCLTQALAGRYMLLRRRLPVSVSIGVDKSESMDLLSHAWLKSGDVFVSGEKGHESFKVILNF